MKEQEKNSIGVIRAPIMRERENTTNRWYKRTNIIILMSNMINYESRIILLIKIKNE